MKKFYDKYRNEEEMREEEQRLWERPFLQLPIPECPPELREAVLDEESEEKEERRVIIIDL